MAAKRNSGNRLEIGFDISELEKKLKEAQEKSSHFLSSQFHKLMTEGAKQEHDISLRRISSWREIAKLSEKNTIHVKESVTGAEKELSFLNKKLGILEKISEKQKLKEFRQQAGGGGAGSGSGGGDGGSAFDYNYGSRKYRGARNMASIGSDVGYMATQYQQAQLQGFSGGSNWRLAGSVASAIPIAGPLFDTAANLVGGDMDRTRDAELRRYHAHRQYGGDVYNTMRDFHEPSELRSRMIMLGLDQKESESAITGVAATGMKTSNFGNSAVNAIAGLQSGFGQGAAGTDLLGSMRRVGITDDKKSLDALGSALGVAFTTGLEKARAGEAFSNLARAAQSVTNGVFSLSNVAASQSFVGRMGDAFKGNSASGLAAQDTLQSMTQGKGGSLFQIASLRAAGFGSGTSFATASLKSRLGYVGGGVSDQDFLKQLLSFDIVKQAWGPGTKPGHSEAKNNVLYAITADPNCPYDPEQLLQLLDTYAYKGGAGDAISPIARGITELLQKGGFTGSGHDIGTAQQVASGQKVTVGAQETHDENNLSFLADPIGAVIKFRGKLRQGSGVYSNGPSISSPGMAFPGSGQINSMSQFEAKYGGGRKNMGFGDARDTKPDGHGGYASGERFHMAQDQRFPPGTPVAVPYDGTVGDIGATNGPVGVYGYTIDFRLDEPKGYLLRYHHIEKPMVNSGDSLKAGRQIGTVINRERFAPGKGKVELHAEAFDAQGHPLMYSRAVGLKGMNTTTMGTLGIGGPEAQKGGSIDVIVSENRSVVTTNGPAFKSGGVHTGSR